MQAAGVTLYIFLFVLLVTQLHPDDSKTPEILAATFFLISFVFSALVCGMLLLGYPARLALAGKIKRAAQVVAWSGLSLVIILLVVAAILLLLG